jgi:hypothetical protein
MIGIVVISPHVPHGSPLANPYLSAPTDNPPMTLNGGLHASLEARGSTLVALLALKASAGAPNQ